ncbi:MAG: GNAT family N-acetyltransferase [Raineya sp.]|jgi:ribosomal protein S18 acetylase RimI-like enzyme|nr:GNAT family N-acetyltransferase [Raineya sp.]
MIEILDYSEENKSFIKTLNVEWLEKYFAVEPNDEKQLSNPKEEIIDKGGMIFYARYKGGIVGCAALMKVDEQTYELSKMAVTESYQGLGVGKKLIEHCLDIVQKQNIEKLILYSNTKLEAAIEMYKKYGFKEIPFNSTHYKRANIKMELLLK